MLNIVLLIGIIYTFANQNFIFFTNSYRNMRNFFLTLALLLVSLIANAQSLKPITQMVATAQSQQSFIDRSFFQKPNSDLSALPEVSAALNNAILLEWDEAKFQALQSNANTPISLTLPWENGQTITLDLVPAKNFSNGFAVHTASSGGQEVAVDRGIHYWGIVKNNPNSLVTISLLNHEMMGSIVTENSRYTLGAIPNRTDKAHVLYNVANLTSNELFTCYTDDELHRIGEEASEAADRSAGPDNCVRMYIETDYTIFQNKGSLANVVSYMTGVFSQISALYTNELVNVVLHDLFVWDVADPYTGPSASNYLNQFRTALNGVFNGDLAHLVGINGLGGVAYVDVLCNSAYGVGYSSINATYSNVPTYSWTIEVLTHEIGHNLGSPHTHACAWNGNNTAIDGCGPTAGYSEGCTAANPVSGTIMSYCHLVSGVGINFNNGFGPQPGDLIRNKVYNAPCLNPCGGGGGCTYGAINSNNFEAGFGIWTDGGTDCIRTNNATYANSPTFSIQLRDNTSTSTTTLGNQNWASYDEITVDFSYYTVSYEAGEDFWLQKSTNGGASYTTVGDFNAGTQFSNGVHNNATVVVPGPFTSTTRLRFRGDASADDDQVYIDDVVITGCFQNFTNPGEERETPANRVVTEELNNAGITALSFGPNPASDQLMIRFEADSNTEMSVWMTDITGKLMIQNNISVIKGDNNTILPLEKINNGVYILYLKAGDSIITEKIVVSK